jgi:hypothetical protein
MPCLLEDCAAECFSFLRVCVFGALTVRNFLQVEVRGRISEGAVPDVFTAIQSGNSDAVELHMIADTEAVNMQNR